MKYWLVKSEPGEWSWDDHWKKKGRTERWTGVRNYQARNNMRDMKNGDRAFFYHSVKAREIVGILEVVEEFQPDPTDKTGKFGMVVFKAIEPMKRPISLDEIKERKSLKDMVLVNNTRLSVQPVTKKQWDTILKMAEK